MVRVIPFLSATQNNAVSGYRRYHNAIGYITSLSEQIPSSPDLLKKCGYAKFNKFREHRKGFDALARNVPLSYLRAIGIDLDRLKQCLDDDMEEFNYSRDHLSLYASCATIYYGSFFYRTIQFPKILPEKDAIEAAREYFMEKKLRGFILFMGFKMVWIDQNGRVSTFYYPPDYAITRHWLMINSNGRQMGNVYLG